MQGLIHHIELYVNNLDETKKFWSWLLIDQLGYSVSQEWDQGISYSYGETYIVFVQTEDKYLDISYHRCGTGINHLAFKVDDESFVDTITKELEEKNITILYRDRHPYAGGKGYYAVFFEDPNRIKVELVVSE